MVQNIHIPKWYERLTWQRANELKHLLHIPFGGVNWQEVLTEERKLLGIVSSDPTLRNDWARTGCRERGSCFLIAGDIRTGTGLSLTRLRLERWGYRFSLRLLRHREPLWDRTDYMRMIYYIYLYKNIVGWTTTTLYWSSCSPAFWPPCLWDYETSSFSTDLSDWLF